MSKRTLYRLVWIPSVVSILVMGFMFSKQPLDVPEPTEMLTYRTDDKMIVVKHPGNWKATTLSMHAVVTVVTFEPSRNIRIQFTADLAGSLLADAFTPRTGEGIGGMPVENGNQSSDAESFLKALNNTAQKQKSPLELMHESQSKSLMKEHISQKYKEEKAAKVELAGKEAMVSAFNFEQSGFMSTVEMVGKRFTALTGDRHIDIIYQCPRDTEKEIAPIFDKMIASLQVNGG